jgi:hypothetical protein
MSLRASLLAGVLTGLVAIGAAGVRAQGTQAPQTQAPRPQYLPFAEFSADDSSAQVAAKQAYNEAVERYNKALYDYHVTLGQHDHLVDIYNRAGVSPAEQEKARAEAVLLRAKLETLRREATTLAAAVDQARRKASQVGVTLTR